MGLMTAYQAAPLAESVTVLDRSRVGDTATASFGLTRSVRNDYRDPEYARLGFEARHLWREFERDCGRRLLVDCGCLKLVKGAVTPDLASTTRWRAAPCWSSCSCAARHSPARSCGTGSRSSTGDGGRLDVDAGFADLAAVTQALREGLDARGVRVVENTEPRAITKSSGSWIVATDNGPVESEALVVTVGLGTNDVLGLGARLPGQVSRRDPTARSSQSTSFRRPDTGPCTTRRLCRCSLTWISGSTGTRCTRGRRPGVKIGLTIRRRNTGGGPDRGAWRSSWPSASPGCATRRWSTWPPLAASRPAGMTWWHTMTSFSVRCRARTGSTPGSAGAARATGRALGGPGPGPAGPAAGHRLRHRALSRPPGSPRKGWGGFMSSVDHGPAAGGRSARCRGLRFELERRGYIKAGPFVPEVVLDFPDAVRELHREFLRAGADVMVVLTYYAHREKLRDVGREDDLEAMNRQAVAGSPARSRARAMRWRPVTSATPGPTTRMTRPPSRPFGPCTPNSWAGPPTKASISSSRRPMTTWVRR